MKTKLLPHTKRLRAICKLLTAIVLTISLVVFSCCVSTGASGRYQGRSQPKIAYVVSDRELDDYTIHNAITAELQKRGFRVIDSRDHAPASASNALVVHYLDHWNFDLIQAMETGNLMVFYGRYDPKGAKAMTSG